MKNPINKSLKREFKNNLARYLSIAIIMIVMISAVSGFLTVAYGAKDLVLENQQECNVEDGKFATSSPLSASSKQKIENLSLTMEEQFYSEQEVNEDTMIRIYQNRTNINLVTMHSGRLPNQDSEIALDRLFASKNNLKMNDTITLNDQKLTIVGFVSLPDYTSLIEKNSDLMMDPIHFGVAIVNEGTLNTFIKDNVIYNYSYYAKDRTLSDKENYDILNNIKDICIQDGYTLENLMTAQMNQAISFLPNDMGSDIPMIQTLLYIILVILAFIFVVISQAIIEDQSTVIGTLLANGYTKHELIIHYMILPIIIIIISALIGNVLGYTLFPPLFSNMYYNSYCLPPLEIHFIKEAFLSTTIIPFIFMMSILYLMLYYTLRIPPLRFLRNDLRKRKHRKYISLRNGRFMNRFRMRIILQNKGSYITLCIGIIFASFIFMFGMIMTPSMNHYIDNSKQSIKADYQYILKAPVESDGEKTTITSLETHYSAGDLDLDVTFYGLQNNSKYFLDITLPKGKKEIIVSSDLAAKLSVNKGDTLTFKDSNIDKKYTYTIYDIYDYAAGFSVFLQQKNVNTMLEKDDMYFNGYLSNKKLDIPEEYIQSMITKNDIIKIGEQMTQTFVQMIPIMTIVAIVIYIVVMYILTKLVLDRNARNMSLLKVIGYTDKEIKGLYLHATTYVVLLSLIVALPLCGIGLQYLMKFAFMKFASYIIAYIPLYVYGLVFVTGLFAYLLINFILTKRITLVDLALALKDNE